MLGKENASCYHDNIDYHHENEIHLICDIDAGHFGIAETCHHKIVHK
jgi:hypothetical protein